MTKKTRVLFICTQNAARSQMAEAMLREYAGDRYEVHSAGLEPAPIHPETIQVMEEAGFDMSGHEAKEIARFLGKVHFGYLITVCSRAAKNCPIFPGLGQRLDWAVDDPAAVEGSPEERLEAFRQARDELDGRIRQWLAEQG